MKRIIRYMTFGLCIVLLAGCEGKKDNAKDTTAADGGTIESISKKAPIESTDITDFKCFFLADEDDASVGNAEYYFSLEKNEDKITGAARCESYGGPNGFDSKFVSDEAALADLQQLVESCGLEQFNGIYHETQGLPRGYGCEISVSYASGERLYCYDNENNRLSLEQMKSVIDWFAEKTDITAAEQ